MMKKELPKRNNLEFANLKQKTTLLEKKLRLKKQHESLRKRDLKLRLPKMKGTAYNRKQSVPPSLKSKD